MVMLARTPVRRISGLRDLRQPMAMAEIAMATELTIPRRRPGAHSLMLEQPVKPYSHRARTTMKFQHQPHLRLSVPAGWSAFVGVINK